MRRNPARHALPFRTCERGAEHEDEERGAQGREASGQSTKCEMRGTGCRCQAKSFQTDQYGQVLFDLERNAGLLPVQLRVAVIQHGFHDKTDRRQSEFSDEVLHADPTPLQKRSRLREDVGGHENPRSWRRRAPQRTRQEPEFPRLILSVSPETYLLHEIVEKVEREEQPALSEKADRLAVKSVGKPRRQRCKRRCKPIPLTRAKLDREGTALRAQLLPDTNQDKRRPIHGVPSFRALEHGLLRFAERTNLAGRSGAEIFGIE